MDPDQLNQNLHSYIHHLSTKIMSNIAPEATTTEPTRPSRRHPLRRTCRHAARASNSASHPVAQNIFTLAIFATIAIVFVNAALRFAILIVAVLMPAWQTFKALENRPPAQPAVQVEQMDDDDDIVDQYIASSSSDDLSHVHERCTQSINVDSQNWTAYWIMASCYYAVDNLCLSPLLGHVLPTPIYSAMTFSALAWLTGNGAANARHLYMSILRPVLLTSEQSIDMVLHAAVNQIDVVSQHAVVQVNSMVAPYAKKLDRMAAKTTRKLQQSNPRVRRRW